MKNISKSLNWRFKYVNVNLFQHLVLVYLGHFLVYKWFTPYENEVDENSVCLMHKDVLNVLDEGDAFKDYMPQNFTNQRTQFNQCLQMV